MAAGNLVWLSHIMPADPAHKDFRIFFVAAEVGWRYGWQHLYDMARQERLMAAFGSNFEPYLNPPVLAWLVSPLTALGFWPAYTIWEVLLASALLLAWWLGASGDRWARVAHLCLAIGFFPLALALAEGQPNIVTALAVIAAVRLIEGRRPGWAGAVLALATLKPQPVPYLLVALIAARQWRTLGVFTALELVLSLAQLASVGTGGVASWLHASSVVAAGERQLVLSGLLPGWAILPLAGLGLGISAWRGLLGAREGLAAGLACGVLAAPYLTFTDLWLLMPACWLAIPRRPPAAATAVLVAAYVVLSGAVLLAYGSQPGRLLVIAVQPAVLTVILFPRAAWRPTSRADGSGQAASPPARTVPPRMP